MQRRFSRFSQAFFSSLQKRGNHHHKRKAILQQPYWLIAIPAGACAGTIIYILLKYYPP